MNFSEFNFSDDLNQALSLMGFEKPTPIQEGAIPIIQKGNDIIGCAQTGTGKTAAFLLPLLNKLSKGEKAKNGVTNLIIVPTRELALQIDQQLEGFGYFVGASSLPVYGGGDGADWDQQKQALMKGADFIIATPGRLISQLKMGYVKIQSVQHLVLDEADRMLDMGFLDDILNIARHLPKDRQTLLFSATMPDKIRHLARKILKDPEEISLALSKPAEGVLQGAYVVYDNQKIPLLETLLQGKETYQSIIIFSSSKKMVREISRDLKRKGFDVNEISSDLEQDEREKVMRGFASRKFQILVATDVISRGIDIKDISLIINFDVPHDAEDYVHRVGRTARADTTGVALTLINPRDQRRFAQIEKLIGSEVQKINLPEEVGEGPAYEPHKSGRGGYGGGRRNPYKGGGGKRGGKHPSRRKPR
jgi:ATP-dependent RNA helicase RhlE